MTRGHDVGGTREGFSGASCAATAAQAPPGRLSLTPPPSAGFWRLFQLFPDRDLLGQMDHFLDRKEKAPRGWGYGG